MMAFFVFVCSVGSGSGSGCYPWLAFVVGCVLIPVGVYGLL